MTKQSRLAHGNTNRSDGRPTAPKNKSFRKGQTVEYTGKENPDERFMGKIGKIVKVIDRFSVHVKLNNGREMQMNRNDLTIVETMKLKDIATELLLEKADAKPS